MEELNIDKLTRNKVVRYYSKLILSNAKDETIREFNDKILKKWKPSGLLYIKDMAWKLIQNKQLITVGPQHWGAHKTNAEEFGYNSIVITGPVMGSMLLNYGRVVQVRKKSGAFGSDTVFIREVDGGLQAYHNMGFFSVADQYKELFEKAMKTVDSLKLDKPGDSYSLEGKNEAIGFVVNGLDDTNGKVYSFAMTIEKDKSGTKKVTITT